MSTPYLRPSSREGCRTRRSPCLGGAGARKGCRAAVGADGDREAGAEGADAEENEGSTAMKVAVTSRGPTLDDEIDPRFGRAQTFLVVDTHSGEFEAVDNKQNLEAAQGAGIQAGRIVAEHGAEVVITGHCGPNAFRTLKAAGVKVVVGAEGTVREAVERFKEGDLKPAEDADVEGHWV